MNNKSYFVLGTLLALVVSWIPISRFLLGFDHNGRTALVIMILLLLIYSDKIKKVAFKWPLISMLFLNIYISINSVVKGLNGYIPGPFVFFSLMICPLVFMWMIVLMSKKDFDKTLKCLLGVFYFYAVITLLFDSVSQSHGGRFGDVINANTIAINVLFTIIFSSLLFLRRQLSLLQYSLLLILPVYLEIITASRMGFVAMAIILMAVYLLSAKLTLKNVTIFILVGVVIFLGFNFIIDKTVVGERLLYTQVQSDHFSEMYETGLFIDFLGDRGPQYYLSWPVFLQNFFTGIGFGNWRLLNPLGHVCHSQYLVLYVENGIIGFILYFSPFVWFFRKLLGLSRMNIKRVSNTIPLFLTVTLVVMLIMNLVLWSYDVYGYYAIFALGYVIVSNKEKILAT